MMNNVYHGHWNEFLSSFFFLLFFMDYVYICGYIYIYISTSPSKPDRMSKSACAATSGVVLCSWLVTLVEYRLHKL